jgi:predicted transcriptional regulator
VADKTMTLRLPEAQAEALDTVAEILDVPVVEVVRLAIAEFIDHRRREPSFQRQLRHSVDRFQRAMEKLSWPDPEAPSAS